MRVFITGANGLVGSRLVRLMASRGHQVFGLGRGPHRAIAPSGAVYLSVDLAHAERVVQELREVRPDVVINCAAMTDVDGCERDALAAWTANVEAVATLAKGARELDAHLLHVSTDYVFDGTEGPYDVDAVPNPRGVYALTKHAAEEAVRALCTDQHWTIARTAVVYGWPSTGKNNFGSWLIEALGRGKAVKLFVDQWVSPSHAGSVAEMLGELAERRRPGLWHTCGAEVVDRVSFGRELCARFGFNPSLITPSRMADVKLPSPRPAKSGLVVTKTAQTLSVKPLSLEAALARLHAEYLESNT